MDGIQQQKGEYKDLFEDLLKQGFVRARVDGTIHQLKTGSCGGLYQGSHGPDPRRRVLPPRNRSVPSAPMPRCSPVRRLATMPTVTSVELKDPQP